MIGVLFGILFASIIYLVIIYPLSGVISFITVLIIKDIDYDKNMEEILRRSLDVYLGVSFVILYLLFQGIELPWGWLSNLN